MACKDCSGEGPTPEVEQSCPNRLLPPTPRCGTHRQTTAVCLSQAGLPHSPSLGSGLLCSCCQGSWETHDTVRRYGREREMTEQKGYMPCALSLPSIVDSIQALCYCEWSKDGRCIQYLCHKLCNSSGYAFHTGHS